MGSGCSYGEGLVGTRSKKEEGPSSMYTVERYKNGRMTVGYKSVGGKNKMWISYLILNQKLSVGTYPKQLEK